MSHRDAYGTTGGGCGVVVLAVVIGLIALAALTKGSLW